MKTVKCDIFSNPKNIYSYTCHINYILHDVLRVAALTLCQVIKRWQSFFYLNRSIKFSNFPLFTDRGVPLEARNNSFALVTYRSYFARYVLKHYSTVVPNLNKMSPFFHLINITPNEPIFHWFSTSEKNMSFETSVFSFCKVRSRLKFWQFKRSMVDKSIWV